MYGHKVSYALMSLASSDNDMELSLKDAEISHHTLRTIVPIP